MENVEYVSFVIVVIGDGYVEVFQYWEAEVSKRFDYIADAVVAFSNKHGVVIERVIIRPIHS